MAAITTWTRLEPRVRADDLAPSLEARVHDAAWLLGRQWQLGEFVGEDTGTPIHVVMQGHADPIVAYRTGAEAGPLDPSVPLDCLVGAEPRAPLCLSERAEAGAELLQLLAEAGCSQAGVAALVGELKMPEPEGPLTGLGTSLLSLTAGRLPDGGALEPHLANIARSGRIPAQLPVPAADTAAVVGAARAWVAWRELLVDTAPASSWCDEQLEYHFTLGVQPPTGAAYALTAPAWDGDRLDWPDLEVDLTQTPPTGPAPSLAPLNASGLPTPLVYPGMPASRWWEFEDARVNFAQVTANPEDLARMLVVEFASVYGNDWYLWPLPLPLGALHRVTTLEVINTFGDRISVPPTASDDWQLFRSTERRSTGAPGVVDGLLLLPGLVAPLDGEIFEDVRLLRDEMANLAWAVEATVRGQDGLPFDRHSAAAAAGELSAPAQDAGGDGPLRYRLETEVPSHWFPLAPDAGGAPTFKRLLVRRVDGAGQAQVVRPLGAVLAPENLWLWQEEVPREGARVVRRHRMARGADGHLHVWVARRSGAGRGEGSSGLRYDDALHGATP